MENLHDKRKVYDKSQLLESEIKENPIEMFRDWFLDAEESPSVSEANAMSVSTVENDVSIIANGVFKGKSLNELINDFPEQDRPSQINAVFQFYHIMVAIGLFLIALTFYASFLWFKGKLFETK